jgi:hypothetical protein
LIISIKLVWTNQTKCWCTVYSTESQWNCENNFFFSFFWLCYCEWKCCNKVSSKNIRLQKFCKNVAKGLVCDVGKEIIEQPRATSVGRLVGKNYYAFKVPATHSKVKGRSQRTCKVCADTSKHWSKKAVKKFTIVYCPSLMLAFV